MLELSIDTLQLGLTELRSEIQSIATGKAADNGHDKASRIAFLTARVGSIADSLRKVEAARTKRDGELTLARIVAWLRDQPKDVHGQLVRELHSIEHRGGRVL